MSSWHAGTYSLDPRDHCTIVSRSPSTCLMPTNCGRLCFFPGASERRVVLIVGVCQTSSHLHIFSSSHPHIFTSSHLHILTSSHLHIFSSSHLHIFSSSHLHIFTSSHLHICSSSHLHIFSSSHRHSLTPSSHPHIFTSAHLLIFTFSQLHILTSSHLLIFSSSHLLIFTSSHLHIFTSSHLHILTSSHPHTFTSSHSLLVLRTPRFFSLLASKCASRHNGVHFLDISTSKSGPDLVCFVHFDFEMCFAPQRRALFGHLNFQKRSEAEVLCTF